MAGWNRSDKIAATGVLIALLGFALVIAQVKLAADQLEQAQLHQRAQLLANLHERGLSDPGNAAILRKIEYRQLRFDGRFHGSVDQENLVKLLSFLELVASLVKLELVAFADVEELFGYYIVAVHRNDAVQEYRAMLARRAESQNLPKHITFRQFAELAERIEASTTGDVP